jgi:hypothetical protein
MEEKGKGAVVFLHHAGYKNGRSTGHGKHGFLMFRTYRVLKIKQNEEFL